MTGDDQAAPLEAIRRTLRHRLYLALEPDARNEPGISPLNLLLIICIVLAVILAVIETEPMIVAGREQLFLHLQMLFGAIFAAEYVARLWVAAERPGPGTAGQKRWRFARSPGPIIDLIVILALLVPLFATNSSELRLLRLVRIVAVARMGQLSRALRDIWDAVFSRRFELAVTAGLGVILVLFGATLLYWLEGTVQPDKFGSIPRALWWALVTITTIGYGDAYPITVGGKVAAGCIAIAGIGLIAMPAGIMASAFSEAMQKHHARHHHDI